MAARGDVAARGGRRSIAANPARMPRMSRALLCAMTLLVLLAGCSKPKPPEKERPVDPQATQLRDAMQAPIEQARKAQEEAKAAEQAQRAAIDAATGSDGG